MSNLRNGLDSFAPASSVVDANANADADADAIDSADVGSDYSDTKREPSEPNESAAAAADSAICQAD